MKRSSSWGRAAVLAPVVGSVVARDSRREPASGAQSAGVGADVAHHRVFALLRFARFVRFGSMKA